MEFRLERIVHGGRTLTRLPDGRIALVGGGIPGERVQADLKTSSGVLQGVVQTVLEPSPDRIAASPHAGLDYSFIRYERQLELKREVVADALGRSLKLEVEVPPVHPAPEQWGYRHTVQPAVVDKRLGYRHPGSHDVMVLDADPVAHDSINRLWAQWDSLTPPKGIREVVFRCNDAGELLLSLVASASSKNYLPFAHDLLRAGATGVQYAEHDPRGRFRSGYDRLAGERSILQRYGDFEVSVTATGFAQPNPAAASLLYRQLVEWAGMGGTALDLYAGSGIIGLHLSRTFDKVIALEIDRGSISRGQRDAERLGVGNLEFIKADAKYLEVPPEAELVCVDPPRSGLSKEVRAALVTSNAKRLVYVSCDVATWARDVGQLLEAGFNLTRMQPYDFYPQTHHIEMLSLLER